MVYFYFKGKVLVVREDVSMEKRGEMRSFLIIVR